MSKTKLENFNELDVKIEFKSIIDKYAKDCADGIKRKSPRGRSKNKAYADGWGVEEITKYTKKKKDTFSQYGMRVYNATKYNLTHLLENGHIIANKKNGVGWASARPHIEVVYQAIKEPFIKAMENAKKEVEIK